MDNNRNKWLTSHRTVNIGIAIIIGLMVLQVMGIDFSVSGAPPAGTDKVDWSAVHKRIAELYGTDSGDQIAGPVDIMVIDAFLTLRDSTVQALKDAVPISTWKELDDIPGFAGKRLYKVYCLGYDLG